MKIKPARKVRIIKAYDKISSYAVPEINVFYSVVDSDEFHLYIGFPGPNENGYWDLPHSSYGSRFIFEGDLALKDDLEKRLRSSRVDQSLVDKFLAALKTGKNISILSYRMSGLTTLLKIYGEYVKDAGLTVGATYDSSIESGKHYDLIIVDTPRAHYSVPRSVRYNKIIYAQTGIYMSECLNRFLLDSTLEKILVTPSKIPEYAHHLNDNEYTREMFGFR